MFFEPRDLWVGVYWTHGRVYVCLLPTLPILFEWSAS